MTQADGTSRIDTHHHIVPPFYADWLHAKGLQAGGLPIPTWSASASLEVMDTHDVSAAVLSVSTPGVHLGDDAEARALARDVNDHAAQVVKDHPDRFGFFATLPLPDVDGSLAEMDRAYGIGADGVVLLANHASIYLGDHRFDPVFDELQRRRAVVFVHPSLLPGLEPLDGIPTYVADFLLDTTRAAVNLARSGTLDRCPDVRIILAHAGGFLPYAAYRLALSASAADDFLAGFGRLQRFYFDVALSSTPTALAGLLQFTTPDRVTYGSDFPYAPAVAVDGMDHLYRSVDLSQADRAQIDRGTAVSLFPRFG